MKRCRYQQVPLSCSVLYTICVSYAQQLCRPCRGSYAQMDQNHQLLFEPAYPLEILLDRTPLLTDVLSTLHIPKTALNKPGSNPILFSRQTPPHPTPAIDREYVTAIVQKTPPLARLDWVVYQRTNVDFGCRIAVCKPNTPTCQP
jgi:hypothetical protein